MKKIIFLIAGLIFISAPIFAESNTESVRYMNQSQGFAGFSKSLPKSGNFSNLEKPTKVQSYEKEYDYYGFEIENPPVTEKKVIKVKQEGVDPATLNKQKSAPMTYDNFPKFYDNNNMMQNGAGGMNSFMMPQMMF